MTGLEMAAVIAEQWPTMPVLLVSGEGAPPDSYRGGYLAKPFLPDTLVEAVAGLSENQGPHREPDKRKAGVTSHGL